MHVQIWNGYSIPVLFIIMQIKPNENNHVLQNWMKKFLNTISGN